MGTSSGAPQMSPWPTDIRWSRAERVLHITFDDGSHWHLSGEYLRVESPSAEVQGHSPDQKQIVTGKQSVGLSALEPVGNYAVRLVFDDGHDTGIYSWAYLYELAQEYPQRWAAYQQAAAAKSGGG